MRRLLLVLMRSGLATAARAEISTNATYDDLLYAAVRYGNTEARRADKEAARAELFRRGPDALREVMNRIHYENVMLQVLAMELVREKIPAEAGVPVLMEFVASERVETRRIAIYFLGFYPAPEQPERILVGLSDEKTRNATLRTASQWKLDAVRDELRGLLKESEQEKTRVLAANALRVLGNKDDLPALMAALNDPVFTVRNAAARAVASHGWAAHRPLLNALAEARGPARRQVVRLLGELRVKSAVRPLRRLLDARDEGLRVDAARALRQIDATDAARWLAGAGVEQVEAEALFIAP